MTPASDNLCGKSPLRPVLDDYRKGSDDGQDLWRTTEVAIENPTQDKQRAKQFEDI